LASASAQIKTAIRTGNTSLLEGIALELESRLQAGSNEGQLELLSRSAGLSAGAPQMSTPRTFTRPRQTPPPSASFAEDDEDAVMYGTFRGGARESAFPMSTPDRGTMVVAGGSRHVASPDTARALHSMTSGSLFDDVPAYVDRRNIPGIAEATSMTPRQISTEMVTADSPPRLIVAKSRENRQRRNATMQELLGLSSFPTPRPPASETALVPYGPPRPPVADEDYAKVRKIEKSLKYREGARKIQKRTEDNPLAEKKAEFGKLKLKSF
jgi:hypothetical protein